MSGLAAPLGHRGDTQCLDTGNQFREDFSAGLISWKREQQVIAGVLCGPHHPFRASGSGWESLVHKLSFILVIPAAATAAKVVDYFGNISLIGASL